MGSILPMLNRIVITPTRERLDSFEINFKEQFDQNTTSEIPLKRLFL